MIKFNWTLENLGAAETPKFMWYEDSVKREFRDKIEYIEDQKYIGEWDPLLKKPHGFGLKLFNENKTVRNSQHRFILDILSAGNTLELEKRLERTGQMLGTTTTECLKKAKRLALESVFGQMVTHMREHGMEEV